MPDVEIPSPSLDRPTCCRMVAVFSTLWDEGARPRPGVVISDNGMHTRVKVLLDETDTEAIRHLLTTSGTADAVVPLHVFDALTQDQRNAIMAKTGPEHYIWAEWPARPKLGIPVVGSVGHMTQGGPIQVQDVGQTQPSTRPGDPDRDPNPEPAQPGKDPAGVELPAPVNNPDATPPGSPAGSHASTFTDP